MYEDVELEESASGKYQALLGAQPARSAALDARTRARASAHPTDAPRFSPLVPLAPPRLAARKWQHYLDLSAPHTGPRWVVSALVVFIYCLRVYLINGWYIITYGLGIYVLNLLIGFLSPQSDPEIEGPTLPTSKDDEFRPFIRRLPEFKFWYALTKAFCIAFVMTYAPLLLRTHPRRRPARRDTVVVVPLSDLHQHPLLLLRTRAPIPAEPRAEPLHKRRLTYVRRHSPSSLARSFFKVFDIPVFWPILLLYFIALFVLTMKRQIKHMIKYKYVPFSLGKQRYKGREDEGGARRSAD
jgi:hypothetical protein